MRFYTHLSILLILFSHNGPDGASGSQYVLQQRPRFTLETCAKACLEEKMIQCQYFKFVGATDTCLLTSNSAPDFSTGTIQLKGSSPEPVGPFVKPAHPKIKLVRPKVIPVRPKVKPVVLKVKPERQKLKPVRPLVEPVKPIVKPGVTAQMLLSLLTNKYGNIQTQLNNLQNFQKGYSDLKQKIQMDVESLQGLQSTSEKQQKALAGHQQLLALLSHNLVEVGNAINWLHSYEQLLDENIDKVGKLAANESAENLVKLRQTVKQFLQIHDRYFDRRLRKYDTQKAKLWAKMHQLQRDVQAEKHNEATTEESLEYVLQGLQSLADLWDNMKNNLGDVKNVLDTVEDKTDKKSAREDDLQARVNNVDSNLQQFEGNITNVIKPLAENAEKDTTKISALSTKVSKIQNYDGQFVSQLSDMKKSIASLVEGLTNMAMQEQVLGQNMEAQNSQSLKLKQKVQQLEQDQKTRALTAEGKKLGNMMKTKQADKGSQSRKSSQLIGAASSKGLEMPTVAEVINQEQRLKQQIDKQPEATQGKGQKKNRVSSGKKRKREKKMEDKVKGETKRAKRKGEKVNSKNEKKRDRKDGIRVPRKRKRKVKKKKKLENEIGSKKRKTRKSKSGNVISGKKQNRVKKKTMKKTSVGKSIRKSRTKQKHQKKKGKKDMSSRKREEKKKMKRKDGILNIQKIKKEGKKTKGKIPSRTQRNYRKEKHELLSSQKKRKVPKHSREQHKSNAQKLDTIVSRKQKRTKMQKNKKSASKIKKKQVNRKGMAFASKVQIKPTEIKSNKKVRENLKKTIKSALKKQKSKSNIAESNAGMRDTKNGLKGSELENSVVVVPGQPSGKLIGSVTKLARVEETERKTGKRGRRKREHSDFHMLKRKPLHQPDLNTDQIRKA